MTYLGRQSAQEKGRILEDNLLKNRDVSLKTIFPKWYKAVDCWNFSCVRVVPLLRLDFLTFSSPPAQFSENKNAESTSSTRETLHGEGKNPSGSYSIAWSANNTKKYLSLTTRRLLKKREKNTKKETERE